MFVGRPAMQDVIEELRRVASAAELVLFLPADVRRCERPAKAECKAEGLSARGGVRERGGVGVVWSHSTYVLRVARTYDNPMMYLKHMLKSISKCAVCFDPH